MKVLGVDGQMCNVDVLEWMKQTRQRHAREDAEDRVKGVKPSPRPKNFLDALDKHERHLKSDSYPYEKNPSVYSGEENIAKSKQALNDIHFERIHEPVYEKFKAMIKNKEMEKYEAADKMEEEQLKRNLTDEELLIIYNHAPTNVEQLTPMLEDCEERYTPEELQVFVDVIKEVLRADEVKEKEVASAKPADGAEELAKDPSGMEIFALRPRPSGGDAIEQAAPLERVLPLRLSGPQGPDSATGANKEATGL